MTLAFLFTMVTPCFITSDNLRQKSVFFFMLKLQLTQRKRISSIALFGGHLVGYPIHITFPKARVHAVWCEMCPSFYPVTEDLVHCDYTAAQD
ncbi:hypothetical protein TNCV_1382421 [Trichonephila clavipes]|nr:hypothetical protein TNCV_1382421 [Trichonephila clavipes]